MIANVVNYMLSAASDLLLALPSVFNGVIDLIYDAQVDDLTNLGVILVSTAGFALAWAGIRFIFGFVNRLLSKTRAGR